MRNGFSCALVAIVTAALSVVGCGDQPAGKAAQPAPVADPVPKPVSPGETAATPDRLGPRYDATLAQGIDFARRGYPQFVADVSGISDFESWGRWSDANLGPSVRIRFRQALPSKLTLEITANAFGPNLGQAVRVRIGQAEKEFVHSDPRVPGSYRLTFDAVGGDTIEIIPPRPVSPAEVAGTTDVRKVGIGLIALKVFE